jgi:predicted nuclease of predicted toxin-antitoxin system
MKYIVDAQLPKKLSNWLNENGYESIHTLDLPEKNDTQDSEIIRISTEIDDSVVISKDRDFPDYRFIKKLPTLLLWVTTGNIINKELLKIFEEAFKQIDNHFQNGKLFIELTNDSIIVHE